MADNRFDLELGLDFSKVTEALQQIKSQFTGTSAEFQKIANKFKDSFNTMTNAIKLYGMESSQAKTATKSMERAMVELTKNGIDPASIGFQQLSSQIGPLASKMKGAGDSVKKSNMQWTNLALVVQDLPYGFRGIQNNLPALMGGIAGMAGPIYFVGSAIIALFTAWDNGMIKFGNTLTSVELKQKAFNDVLDKSKDSYTEAKTQVMLLNDQVAEAAGKKDLERKAVKDYNDTIGESLGKLKTFKEVQSSLIDQGDKYIDYIFKLNMANTAASKVAEESANMLIASFKKPLDFVNNIDKLFAVQFNMFGDLASAATGTAKKLYESGKENQQEAIQGFGKSAVAAEEVMKIFRQQAKEAKKLLSFGTFDEDKKGGKQKDNYLLDKLKAQQQAQKDDIYAFRAYGILIINEEERLAVVRAKVDGTYLNNKKDLHARYDADRLTNNNLFEEKLNKVLDDNAKIRVAIEKKELDEKEKARKAAADAAQKINDRNLQNALTALKIESDVAIKIANASGKTTAADRIQILENYKSKLYELASTGGYTAEQFDKISDALVNVDAAIAGSQDKVKSFNITWIDTINNINSVIMDFINNSMAALGESIGKALAGENIDVINVFGSLLADALTQIGKQLIAFATASLFAWALLKSNNPITAAAALVAGIAAVAAGSFMKSRLEQDRSPKKFANGGIISGPTMGLMGEYPGAKTNPEEVAP